MSTAFRVTMTGGQEVPPNGSGAGGLGTVIFDSVAVTASYEMNVRGLDFGPVLGFAPQTANPNDDVAAMHVHNAAFGVNGPVVFGQRGPAQDITGVAFSAVINPNGSTTFQGRWEASDPSSQPIANFAAALGAAPQGAMVNLYWNVHTSAFPGGEIRGQWECIATDNSEIVNGTNQADILPGLGGDDQVNGGKRNDRLTGGDGDDKLSGGRHNDNLDGGNGKDQIRGDSGQDVLTGGISKDKFLFFALTDSTNAAPDRVTDFDQAIGDKVSLSAIDANTGVGGDQAFTFVVAFGGNAGEAVLTYAVGPDETTLELDVNGDSLADSTLVFDGNVNSTSGWIL